MSSENGLFSKLSKLIGRRSGPKFVAQDAYEGETLKRGGKHFFDIRISGRTNGKGSFPSGFDTITKNKIIDTISGGIKIGTEDGSLKQSSGQLLSVAQHSQLMLVDGVVVPNNITVSAGNVSNIITISVPHGTPLSYVRSSIASEVGRIVRLGNQRVLGSRAQIGSGTNDGLESSGYRDLLAKVEVVFEDVLFYVEPVTSEVRFENIDSGARPPISTPLDRGVTSDPEVKWTVVPPPPAGSGEGFTLDKLEKLQKMPE